jgi:hypothetical protein
MTTEMKRRAVRRPVGGERFRLLASRVNGLQRRCGCTHKSTHDKRSHFFFESAISARIAARCRCSASVCAIGHVRGIATGSGYRFSPPGTT